MYVCLGQDKNRTEGKITKGQSGFTYIYVCNSMVFSFCTIPWLDGPMVLGLWLFFNYTTPTPWPDLTIRAKPPALRPVKWRTSNQTFFSNIELFGPVKIESPPLGAPTNWLRSYVLTPRIGLLRAQRPHASSHCSTVWTKLSVGGVQTLTKHSRVVGLFSFLTSSPSPNIYQANGNAPPLTFSMFLVVPEDDWLHRTNLTLPTKWGWMDVPNFV